MEFSGDPTRFLLHLGGREVSGRMMICRINSALADQRVQDRWNDGLE